MFTNLQLAAWANAVYEAKWVYWYGTCGYKCSKSLYNSKKRQYANHYTADRESGYMKDISNGKMCADCVGMIKAFFWLGGDMKAKNVYKGNNCPDVSANGMLEICQKTGPIETLPDVPGLVVWKNGHIGVYVGGGMVVEENGFKNDCLKRKVSANTWKKWGMLPSSMLKYESGSVTVPTVPAYVMGERELHNGCTGDDVAQLQGVLIDLGYSCGKWGADGEFGDATEMAVRGFQRDHGLIVDGVAGKQTFAAISDAQDKAKADQPVMPSAVAIRGGSCYVRTEPNTSGAIMGVAMEGNEYPFAGKTSDTGWLLIRYKDKDGWVSGKYGKAV